MATPIRIGVVGAGRFARLTSRPPSLPDHHPRCGVGELASSLTRDAGSETKPQTEDPRAR